MSRVTLFYIGAGILILFYISIMVLFFISRPTSPIQSVTPTITSVQENRQNTQQPSDQSTVRESSADKLLNKITDRPSLTEQDAIKRAALVARLQGESGVLQSTDSYTISYLKTPDVFQVEIKEDENTARDASFNWFIDQGISVSAICSLPISYFPSYDLLTQLKAQGKTFSALPKGC